MSEKEIAVIYHGGCPDGFSGAYAAWKIFGDTAEYIPAQHGRPVPEHLAGKELYLIDFCYPQAVMDDLAKIAKSLIVLDHHEGVREIAEKFPGVYDPSRSGATVAWSYFHPDTSVPVLLQYVQDGDLYVFKLPDSRAVLAYAYARKFSFDEWDRLVSEFEDENTRTKLIEKGKIYAEHFAILVEQVAHKAILVSFEGYECYLAGAADMFTSDVGNMLARIKPPFGIIAKLHGDALNVSLRSDDSIDVSAIARKYGGNGHPHAAAFRIPWGTPLPWTVLNENDHPSN